MLVFAGIGWKSWKKRWFILTRTSLVFFKNDPVSIFYVYNACYLSLNFQSNSPWHIDWFPAFNLVVQCDQQGQGQFFICKLFGVTILQNFIFCSLQEMPSIWHYCIDWEVYYVRTWRKKTKPYHCFYPFEAFLCLVILLPFANHDIRHSLLDFERNSVYCIN